jgi:hypothetical protein
MSRPKWPTPSDDELLAELRASDEETLPQRRERLRFIAQETEGPEGATIPGIELEASLILVDSFRSFIAGNFLASVFSAQAFLEHCLATALDARGQSDVSRLRFVELIDNAKTHGLLTQHLAGKIHRLRKLRNPYAHRSRNAGKEWPTWFYKRVMSEADGDYYALAEGDAKLGVECVVDYIRSINPTWVPADQTGLGVSQ